MKGLIRKDLYLVMEHCRTLLICDLVFIISAGFNPDNLSFLFYPVMFCAILPITLLGYDEKDRWEQYSTGLPVTRTQMVTSKYLIGAGTGAASILLSLIIQSAVTLVRGTFSLSYLVSYLCLLVTYFCFASAFGLPFMFKLGVDKGRMVYYVIVGAVTALSVILNDLLRSGLSSISSLPLIPLLALLSLALYYFSWKLSCKFYARRQF